MKQEIRRSISVNGVFQTRMKTLGPLLWRDRGIGWGNLSVKNGKFKSEFGYVERQAARDRAFKRELEAELGPCEFFWGSNREVLCWCEGDSSTAIAWLVWMRFPGRRFWP